MAVPRRSSQTVIKAPTGFRAQLPGLDLPTLLQMTCARGERAVVRVRSGDRAGFIYANDGRLVHARAGSLTGEQALACMLDWSSGDFALCDQPWPAQYSIDASVDAVLIRAAQLRDESADREPAVMFARRMPARGASAAPRQSAPASSNDQEGSVVASVRMDVNGEIVAQQGDCDALASLVAYVARMSALIASQLGLEPFEALSAELGERRALIYVEGREMVGILLMPGPAYQELRRQLGV